MTEHVTGKIVDRTSFADQLDLHTVDRARLLDMRRQAEVEGDVEKLAKIDEALVRQDPRP